ELEERKRAEEQLRRSHEFLRTVLDSLNDEVAIIDASDFTIVDANVSFFTAYGYTREDLLKKTCHEITHQRDDVCSPPHDSCPLLETLRTGGYAATEHIHVDRRGNRIYVEVSSSPIRDKNGRIVRIAHVSRDITERKKTEQALRESEERYQQLSEQLSQSNEELQEINQELKAFMYSAAHDLRQPLVNIQGFTSELRRSVGEVQTMFAAVADRCSPEERAQLARFFSENIMDSEVFIRASVERMSSLINALLKLSQAGHRTLKPELLCMNALMRSLLAGFEQQIRKKNAKVTVGDLPDLVADRTAMEQIMGNLLDNAVKFLVPERPGRVEVSGAKTEGGITYHIRDNGCGISADDMPRLFHLFRRLGRQDTAGEGVGLAYTKALIKRHGGRIWCESEVGVGTTFSFAMPLADLTS
ncbi:MAG TPA: PAS domain-containing sensor histidine kinase, partial [Nitrospirota bacterium]